MPDGPLVLSHGDFHARQMLGLDGDFGVIDFDASCLAPAALDLATYIIDSSCEVSTTSPRAWRRSTCSARPIGRPSARRAVVPDLRAPPPRIDPVPRLPEGWPEQVEERVAARRQRSNCDQARTSEGRGAAPAGAAPRRGGDGARARRMLDDATPPTVRIDYLRYRPGRRLVVCYEVEAGETTLEAVAVAEAGADLAGRASDSRNTRLVRKVVGRTPVRTPLAYEPTVNALSSGRPSTSSFPRSPSRRRRFGTSSCRRGSSSPTAICRDS